MDKSFYDFLEKQQKSILLIFDVAAIAFAIFCSFFIFNRWYDGDILSGLFVSWSTYVGIGTFIFFNWIFKLYKFTWRYVDVDVLVSIIASCCLGTLCLGIAQSMEGYSFLKLVLFFVLVLSVAFISFIRLLARFFSKRKHSLLVSIPKSAIKNLIMVGSHEECALLISLCQAGLRTCIFSPYKL